MNRRVIALVAALLLAGVGTLVLVKFVQGAEDRATAGEELATVWLVQTTVPKGTSGAAIGSYVVQEQVLVKSVPPGAYTSDLQAMQTALTGFVASVDLFPGEVVVNTRWVAEEAFDNERPDIPTRREPPNPRMLQVPVRLSVEEALGGIIQPGETVAIIASFDNYRNEDTTVTIEGGDDVVALPESADDAIGGTGQAEGAATRILINKAYVTEVQAEAVPLFENTEEGVESQATLAPTTGFVVTFALFPEDAERLVFANTYGSLWLALQTEDAYDYPTTVQTLEDIFDDSVPTGLLEEYEQALLGEDEEDEPAPVTPSVGNDEDEATEDEEADDTSGLTGGGN